MDPKTKKRSYIRAIGGSDGAVRRRTRFRDSRQLVVRKTGRKIKPKTIFDPSLLSTSDDETEDTTAINRPKTEQGTAECTEKPDPSEIPTPTTSRRLRGKNLTPQTTKATKKVRSTGSTGAKRPVGRPRGSGNFVRRTLYVEMTGSQNPVVESVEATFESPPPLESTRNITPTHYEDPPEPTSLTRSLGRPRLQPKPIPAVPGQCMRCLGGPIPKNKFVACTSCGRLCHQNCVTHRFMNIRTLRQKFRCDKCRRCSVCKVYPGSQVARVMLLTCIKCNKYVHPRCIGSTDRPSSGSWKCADCSDAQPQWHNTDMQRESMAAGGGHEELPNVQGWTVWEVVTLMRKHFPRLAHVFLREEIDGNTLLVMTRDEVLNDLELKRAPALSLFEFIYKLQQRSGYFPY